MNNFRKFFSFVMATVRLVGFVATIALHGGDIAKIIHMPANALNLTSIMKVVHP